MFGQGVVDCSQRVSWSFAFSSDFLEASPKVGGLGREQAAR